jgi:hypothetical protein
MLEFFNRREFLVLFLSAISDWPDAETRSLIRLYRLRRIDFTVKDQPLIPHS